MVSGAKETEDPSGRGTAAYAAGRRAGKSIQLRGSGALPALVFFLLAYALANLAAFAVVVELRGLSERAAYASLARTRPALAAALTLAFLSFIGIPPLAGFSAKLALFGATIEGGSGAVLSWLGSTRLLPW